MVTRIYFKRTMENTPVIVLISMYRDGSSFEDTFAVSEELYDQWVPDTNHFPGESLSEGVVYDKPIIPNMKAS